MKKFRTSITGYNKNEVNQFVNEVTEKYESMLKRLKESDQQIEKIKQELIKVKEKEMAWTKAFTVAEEASNQIRRAAKEESHSIIDDARRNASRIINDALIKAEHAEQNAQNLKRRVDIYKRKVKEVIREQEEMIDEIGDINY